ncbi:MAG: hypothetical protein HZC38_16830 [Chloroflexi bacterium]|nr:hypothetical protein [Chloroflexota bacterium]
MMKSLLAGVNNALHGSPCSALLFHVPLSSAAKFLQSQIRISVDDMVQQHLA